MIPNKERWPYLAVKKLFALLKGITSKHDGNFYCCHSFKTKDKLESHKNVYQNNSFRGVAIPSEGNKILEFNQYRKSQKTLSIIYADLESLIKKVDGCKNNPEKLSTIKVVKIGEHIPCGYSMSLIWTSDSIENKYDVYRRKDFMKSFVNP